MTKQTVSNIASLFILSIFYSVNARLAPDFIHPCKDLTRECLINATKLALPEFLKGIPELGIQRIDPFYLENVPLELKGMTVNFVKGHAYGFDTCIPDNVELSYKENFFKLDFHCNITVKGLYKAKGRLLLFTIDGEGDAKIELTNFRMKVHINSKFPVDDKGLHHFHVKNYNYSFDYGDKVVFDLENLFKESKELSDTVLGFLNENWKLVTEEFGKPIMDYAVKLAIETVIKFFHIVPMEELVLVPYNE